MINTKRIFDAISFAADRHKNQTRKGIHKIPYINHPLKVAQILSDMGEEDEDLLMAALLHDVIEDTVKDEDEAVKLKNEIYQKFGEVVLNTVLEVSDNKNLPVDERKRLQVLHTPALSERAKKLKIADKISNIQDIKSDPPDNWSKKRKLTYLNWAREVVNGARGLNNKLDQYFDQVYLDVYKYLKDS